MQIFRGVVRDHCVQLPDDADLPDGTEVEIRTSPAILQDDQESNRAFFEALIAAGLVLGRTVEGDFTDQPFEPVRVSGEPISEQIIRERMIASPHLADPGDLALFGIEVIEKDLDTQE